MEAIESSRVILSLTCDVYVITARFIGFANVIFFSVFDYVFSVRIFRSAHAIFFLQLIVIGSLSIVPYDAIIIQLIVVASRACIIIDYDPVNVFIFRGSFVIVFLLTEWGAFV